MYRTRLGTDVGLQGLDALQQSDCIYRVSGATAGLKHNLVDRVGYKSRNNPEADDNIMKARICDTYSTDNNMIILTFQL